MLIASSVGLPGYTLRVYSTGSPTETGLPHSWQKKMSNSGNSFLDWQCGHVTRRTSPVRSATAFAFGRWSISGLKIALPQFSQSFPTTSGATELSAPQYRQRSSGPVEPRFELRDLDKPATAPRTWRYHHWRHSLELRLYLPSHLQFGTFRCKVSRRTKDENATLFPWRNAG